MNHLPDKLPAMLEALGLDEEPMGIHFTDTEPGDGFTPKPLPLPTAEREQAGEIDWQETFGNFSCVLGNVWRARRKKTRAWFSAERFGCPGGAFWMGFMKPQTETITSYVSTGSPHIEGEFYCGDHDALRQVFSDIDPVPAPGKYCVVQPLSLYGPDEEPRFVSFFARPESLCGVHQLAFFVTNDPEVVGLTLGRGLQRAVHLAHEVPGAGPSPGRARRLGSVRAQVLPAGRTVLHRAPVHVHGHGWALGPVLPGAQGLEDRADQDRQEQEGLGPGVRQGLGHRPARWPSSPFLICLCRAGLV